MRTFLLVLAVSVAHSGPLLAQGAPKPSPEDVPAAIEWGASKLWKAAAESEAFARLPKDHPLRNFKFPGRRTPPPDLKPDQLAREQAYTRRWLEKAFRPGFASEKFFEGAQPLAGHRKADDAMLLEFELGGHRAVRVIDGRVLEIAILEEKSHAKDAMAIFKEYFSADRAIESLEQKDLGDRVAHGRLIAKDDRGWFREPIQWVRDGDLIVFSFPKVVRRPPMLVPPQPENEFGGLPLNDPRAFRRFGDANRQQLAAEQFAAAQRAVQPAAVGADPGANADGTLKQDKAR